MNEELKKKIESDIVKAGFYSEMQAIRCFLSHQWYCAGGYHYFDEDEGKPREIDLHAAISSRDKKFGNALGADGKCSIFAEVKKSEKPWVVFKQTDVKYRYENPGMLIAFDRTPKEQEMSVIRQYILCHNALSSTLNWRGYGIHESFKSPDQPSRWYSAFVSISKCAYQSWKLHDEILKKVREELKDTNDFFKLQILFEWIQPIIILDGDLITVELDDIGNMLINQVEAAPFYFYFKTDSYEEKGYFIDVVTLNYLNTYIELSEKWLLDLCMSIHNAFVVKR